MAKVRLEGAYNLYLHDDGLFPKPEIHQDRLLHELEPKHFQTYLTRNC